MQRFHASCRQQVRSYTKSRFLSIPQRVSLNNSFVEACICDRKIGTSNTKGLLNNAAGEIKPKTSIKDKIGTFVPFSTSKKTMTTSKHPASISSSNPKHRTVPTNTHGHAVSSAPPTIPPVREKKQKSSHNAHTNVYGNQTNGASGSTEELDKEAVSPEKEGGAAMASAGSTKSQPAAEQAPVPDSNAESKEAKEKDEKKEHRELPIPKLERQLTSTFDRKHMNYEDLDEIEDEVVVDEEGESDDVDIDEADLEKIEAGEVSAKAEPMGLSESPPLRFFTGEATDIGGGHENQDKAMCFRTGRNKEHMVLAVFDGHGRDLGELAAIVARDYMKDELQKLEVLEKLIDDPKRVLEDLFKAAHYKIKDAFKEKVESLGDWEVFDAPEGYLIKRQRMRGSRYGSNNSNMQLSSKSLSRMNSNDSYILETNIHGGTTATVVIILDSQRLIVANVGDSTALFGGVDTEGRILYKELSAEHSPESLEEYRRVKTCRHVKRGLNGASKDSAVVQSSYGAQGLGDDPDSYCVRFVFDVIDRSSAMLPKHSCPPIFETDTGSGAHQRANTSGNYYKNVRSEWATLVTTPPTARFQDALAFTRSLGDLHLHVYGVTHVPEIVEYDMKYLHQQVTQSTEAKRHPHDCSLLLVCTDGVWDNWKYEDIIRRVLTSGLVTQTVQNNPNVSAAADAQELTDEMMTENIKLANKHFGRQADNMTGILCLIHADPASS